MGSRAQTLRNDEVLRKASLPDHCVATLKGKRVVVFREMLAEAEHADGSRVRPGRAHSWKPGVQAQTSATVARDDLKGSVMEMRKGIINATRSSGTVLLTMPRMKAPLTK